MFFVSCVLFRVYELTTDLESVSAQLSGGWASRRFTVSLGFISILMLLSPLGALITLMVLHSVRLFASKCDLFLWKLDRSQVAPQSLRLVSSTRSYPTTGRQGRIKLAD